MTSNKKPHIALLMMMKNEHQRIHVTLESVIGHVDSIVAFDTGSTDNTIQIVRDFSKKHNIQDKFVVMYSGNFGLTHNIEKMIAASEAMASYQDIIFLIIGGGPKQEVVKKYISATKAKNLIYLPFQNEDMLPYTLTSADIAVVLDSFSANPGSTSTASIPSKTFYLMAAGNAIYAESDDSSELSRIINHFEIGFCDKSQSLENFIKFIKNCYSDRLLLNKLKENSRNASANFSDKNAALLYESIYQNCEDNSLM